MGVDEAFLDPDFDPNTLTIPKLKAILAEAGVELKMSNERKAFYVDLFKKEITQKQSPLRKKARKTIQPSTDSIIKVTRNGSPINEAEAEKQRQLLSETPESSKKNPFQSGSDAEEPTPKPRRNSPSRRRTTTRKSFQPTPLRNSNVAKSEDENPTPRPTKIQPDVQSPKFFKLPEFDLKISGYKSPEEILRTKKAKLRKPWLTNEMILRLTLTFVLIFLSFLIYQLEKWRTLDYCKDDNSSQSMNNNNVYFFDIPLYLPECRLCPAYSYCEGNKILACNNGYLLVRSFFPFHDYCAPDLVRPKMIALMLQQLTMKLHTHAGLVECGEISDDIYLAAVELKKFLKKLNKNIKDDQLFDNYWEEIISEISEHGSRHDISIQKSSMGVLLYSLNPNHPSLCKISLLISRFIQANKSRLFGAVLAILSVSVGYVYWKKRQDYKDRLDMLVSVISELLQRQEIEFSKGTAELSCIPSDQLRDLLLKDIKNFKERQRIWNDVSMLVLRSSTIRSTLALIKGEQMDCWQWIGITVGFPEDNIKQSAY